jgi:hypothetical protein
MKHRAVKIASLAVTLALVGCVVLPPSGPSLQALPGSQQSFEQFQRDDAACREYATAQSGGRGATEAAQESAAASAVTGTLLGAAAGAAFGGSSEGAAVGAGIGLLTGALAGLGASESSYYVVQRRYDGAYYPCMYARGHRVPVASRYSEAKRPPAQPARAPAAPPRIVTPPPDAGVPPPNAPPPSALPYVPPYWPATPPPNAPPPR